MLFLFSCPVQFSSVAQSCPTLWPHESQHARPPCPSPTPGVYSNSCPSSRWCHPAISSSVVPFSSCPQSLPASGSLPMSQLFAWGGQSIGVQFSCPVMSNSLWPHGLEHTMPPCPSPSPEICLSSCPLHWWCHPAISSSDALPSFSALIVSQNQGLFQWISSLYQTNRVLEFQLQHQSFKKIFRIDFPSDWLVWSPCCPGDSQESSPAPQFKDISSSVLPLVYCPALTTLHDHWEDHSLDSEDCEKI